MENFIKKYFAIIILICVVTLVVFVYDYAINNSLTGGRTSSSVWDDAEGDAIFENGVVGIGTTTPTAVLQATTPTANATTTIEFGKANQNKGTCLKMYNSVGTLTYCQLSGTTWSCSTTSCE